MYSIRQDNSPLHHGNSKKNDNLPKLPPLVTRESFLERFKTNDEYYTSQNDISRHNTKHLHTTPIREKDQNFFMRSPLTSPDSIRQGRSNNYSPLISRSPNIESPGYNKAYSPLNRRTHRPPPPPQSLQSSFTFTQNSGQQSVDKQNTNFYDDIEPNDSIIKLNGINLQDNDSISEIFSKPPQVPTALRNITGLRRVSESIESCYSYASYTFNDSSIRHSSYNSLLGGRPLEVAPSVIVPTHPFSISDLDENKLYQCYSVYRLSDIYEWILKAYFEWFTEYVFGQFEFYQMIQRLLEFQIPTSFDQDLIDSNVDKIINSLLR